MNVRKTKPPTGSPELARVADTLSAWPTCRLVVGLVLLTAAGLKAYELATLPMLAPGVLNSRWLLASLVETEAALGGWLLLGGGRFWTWALTFVMWLIFCGVAGYEALSGAESCGCFGRVQINPWYTTLFDLVVIAILAFCYPSRRSINAPRRFFTLRLSTLGLICMAGAAFGAWDLYRYSPRRLIEAGLSFADGTVIMEPQKWVGHPFVLANYIDIGSKLNHGDWIILLYRYDCEHCQRAVPRYEGLAANINEDFAVALVEIPPFAPAGQELVKSSESITIGKLSEKYDWFASTPVMLRVHDGTVMAITEGSAAETPSANLLLSGASY